MRLTSLAALALALAACVPDRPAPLEGASPLAGVVCDDAAHRTIDAWGAGGDYLPGPPGPGASATYRFPTGRIGSWVVATRLNDGGVALTRVEPDGSTRRTFGADCGHVDHTEARSGTGGFTDAMLAEATASAGAGLVVYAWSPHMPLSVDGWTEISRAAATLGLDALPVLIAHADRPFAAREARRVGIPDAGLLEINSVELVMRDLQVHAPAILVFGGDRVSPVLPGYRNADGYGRFLGSFLEGG